MSDENSPVKNDAGLAISITGFWFVSHSASNWAMLAPICDKVCCGVPLGQNGARYRCISGLKALEPHRLQQHSSLSTEQRIRR
eukprot:scaffold151337_cov24-Prasinocladus_malaysianus.AAC.1